MLAPHIGSWMWKNNCLYGSGGGGGVQYFLVLGLYNLFKHFVPIFHWWALFWTLHLLILWLCVSQHNHPGSLHNALNLSNKVVMGYSLYTLSYTAMIIRNYCGNKMRKMYGLVPLKGNNFRHYLKEGNSIYEKALEDIEADCIKVSFMLCSYARDVIPVLHWVEREVSLV